MNDSDSPRQLTLDLKHRPAFGRDDFLVAPCNEAAIALVDRWPEWPTPVAVVFGEEGCGKSHLAAVWQSISGAVSISGEALGESAVLQAVGGHGCFVIDDADRVRDEKAFFHLYNLCRENRGSLLLTGRDAPSRWPLALPDLRSRIALAPAVEIGAPDDATLSAILVKLFSDRQLHVPSEVVGYLVARMERSFRSALTIVEAMDRDALAQRRRLSVPLARDVLEKLDSFSS